MEFTIDVLTAKELEKKGNLKLVDYGGRKDYIAIHENNYYVLVKEKNNSYYELLKK